MPPSIEELISYFSGNPSRKIGVEIELAILDPDTGLSVPYAGKSGIRSLLQNLQKQIGGTISTNHLGDPIGVDLESGAGFALENGGAVEFFSSPKNTLGDLVEECDFFLNTLADIARALRLAVVPGANYPFNRLDDIHWMPKTYGPLLRDYFSSLGKEGSKGPAVMSHVTSTQATFDYASLEEALEMVRMGTYLTPVAVALFANSPLEGGRLSGALSRRTEYFFQSDPLRFGYVAPAFHDKPTSRDFIDWIIDFKMLYRKCADGGCEPVGQPFRHLLRNGFDDGTPVTKKDWVQHLSQIYPDVRLRNTVEMRAADGLPYPALFALPIFWTGLLYDASARTATLQLLQDFSLTDALRARQDAARQGLTALYGNIPINILAKEVLKLAKQGLETRIKQELESPESLSYLDSIEEVLSNGKTFAEQTIDLWTHEFRESPSRYVEYFRL